MVVTGLADGRVLYDTLKDRVHPLGEWRQNIKYPDLYTYLSCLQVSPCNGWLSTNETLRNLTSEVELYAYLLYIFVISVFLFEF